MQRLLIAFARGEQTKYISHLDMMRFWERAFRRAHIILATTSGFHPHPRFALAAPLPVGVTSEGELMEAFLEGPLPLADCKAALSAQLVPGIEVLGVEEMSLQLPSLQSRMRFAEYRVTVESMRPGSAVEQAVADLIALRTLAWEHLRDGELRRYDLRSQIDSLALHAAGEDWVTFEMRLQCDSNASGRPEQVARALGFQEHPIAILRVRLLLAQGIQEAHRPAASLPLRARQRKPQGSPSGRARTRE